MADHFVIDGLKELEAEMKDVDKHLLDGIRVATKEAAKVVAAGVRPSVPVKTGKMAASVTPASGEAWFGARVNHPGAGVQEFATDYIRRQRGSTQIDHYHHRELKTGISRGLKRYYKATGKTTSATEEVHMVHVKGAPPRFLFKALEAIGPGLAEGPVWSKIQDALMANGWWT